MKGKVKYWCFILVKFPNKDHQTVFAFYPYFAFFFFLQAVLLERSKMKCVLFNEWNNQSTDN